MYRYMAAKLEELHTLLPIPAVCNFITRTSKDQGHISIQKLILQFFRFIDQINLVHF